MINKVIALYPGRFQPFAKHHATAFMWLQKQFGANNTYIVTSDKVELPKSPLNFDEKKALIDMYKLGSKVIKVKNPYKAEELMSKFDPKTTAVVFMVGKKDMEEDPRFSMKPKADGSPSYFQPYDSKKYYADTDYMQGFDKHGYLIVAPHVSLNVPGYGEMSGTQVRKALGDTRISAAQKKKLFTDIFGWYSDKLANYIIDKFSNLKESMDTNITPSLAAGFWSNKTLQDIAAHHDADIQKLDMEFHRGIDIETSRLQDANKAYDMVIKNLWKTPDYYTRNVHVNEVGVLTKDWWDKIIENILTEGGAAGHMAYVFDLPNVKTGSDIINVLTKAVDHISKNPVPVKIDGLNTDVRLVVLDGKHQFVMDRGTKKDLDVKGLTKQDLKDRFGEGHGMIKIGGEVLDMFNETLPNIQSELKKLGMLTNPNILLNIEYVAGGKSNIIAYETSKFLAIHNLLELYPTKTGARITKTIPYDKNALESIIQKMQPIAKKYGYVIYGTVPAKLIGNKKPNISKVLNQNITVPITKDNKVTKTLKTWLENLVIPKVEKVTWNKTREPAISKKIFNAIYSGTPVSESAKNKEDYQDIINGYITFLGTMLISQEILDNLTSDIGPLQDQEGLVINNLPPYSQFKIIGKFITKKPDLNSPTSKVKTESITEGGNVFKTTSGEKLTTRIKKEKVLSTVKELEKITKLPLVDNMLGTTGKKADSGDLDLAVDETKITKSELELILKSWCVSHGLDPKQYIRKTGDSVHFKSKIYGTNEYVQVDFMFGEPTWMKWAMRGSSLDSAYKAVHSHVLVSSIAKYHNMKWSYKKGLLNRDDDTIITKDPNKIAKILLGPSYKAKDLDSVEQILNAIKNNPDKELMVKDAKETLNKVYNVDIN